MCFCLSICLFSTKVYFKNPKKMFKTVRFRVFIRVMESKMLRGEQKLVQDKEIFEL